MADGEPPVSLVLPVDLVVRDSTRRGAVCRLLASAGEGDKLL